MEISNGRNRPLAVNGPSVQSPGVDSPLLTPAASDNGEVENENTSNVRIRTRTGSTSTLRMDVEFSHSELADGPVHTSSFAASAYPPLAETLARRVSSILVISFILIFSTNLCRSTSSGYSTKPAPIRVSRYAYDGCNPSNGKTSSRNMVLPMRRHALPLHPTIGSSTSLATPSRVSVVELVWNRFIRCFANSN